MCRPGGTIGMINFVPDGVAGEFFELFGRYAPPPPPGAQPPTAWGSEAHVRELFGDRLAALEMRRGEYAERAASPRDYVELFKSTFGPAVAIYGSLADRPDRLAALDREFIEFAERSNSAAARGGRAALRVPARARTHAQASRHGAARCLVFLSVAPNRRSMR